MPPIKERLYVTVIGVFILTSMNIAAWYRVTGVIGIVWALAIAFAIWVIFAMED